MSRNSSSAQSRSSRAHIPQLGSELNPAPWQLGQVSSPGATRELVLLGLRETIAGLIKAISGLDGALYYGRRSPPEILTAAEQTELATAMRSLRALMARAEQIERTLPAQAEGGPPG